MIQLEKSGLMFGVALPTVAAAHNAPPSRYEEPLPPEPDEDFLPF
jgi:hypothetical protein